MSELLANLLVSVAVALVAGLIAIWSNAWLSQRNKRRDERIRFMLKTYEKFEFGCNRSIIPNPDEFERAVAAIRLLGTPKQIELVEKFMDEMATQQMATTTDLLNELRRELRREIGLEAVPNTHMFFRLNPNVVEETK